MSIDKTALVTLYDAMLAADSECVRPLIAPSGKPSNSLLSALDGCKEPETALKEIVAYAEWLEENAADAFEEQYVYKRSDLINQFTIYYAICSHKLIKTNLRWVNAGLEYVKSGRKLFIDGYALESMVILNQISQKKQLDEFLDFAQEVHGEAGDELRRLLHRYSFIRSIDEE